MDLSAIKDALSFFIDLVEGITKIFTNLPKFFQAFTHIDDKGFFDFDSLLTPLPEAPTEPAAPEK